MSDTYVTKLTADDLAHLRNVGPYTLPDNPSGKNLSASEIKQKFYAPMQALFYWTQNAIVQTDEALEVLYGKCSSLSSSISEETARAEKAESDENLRALSAEQIHSERLDAIETEEAAHVHMKVDSDGYVYNVYPKQDDSVSVLTSQLINRGDALELNANIKLVVTVLEAYKEAQNTNKKSIENILDGTYRVSRSALSEKSIFDQSGKTINASEYACKSDIDYDQTTGIVSIILFNQDGNEIDKKTINLPTELIFDNQGYDSTRKVLWFHPTGKSVGENVEIDVTDLFDIYTGEESPTVSVSVSNNKITASIINGSITMAMLDSALQSTWNSWVSAEETREKNEATRQANESARQVAESARAAAEQSRENNYVLYKDSDGFTCVNYDNLKTIAE